MKYTYEIVGNVRQGNEVLLKLQKHIAVEEKQGMSGILSNPTGWIEQMKMGAIKQKDIEQIRVDFTFWETKKWNIGDLIKIEVESI